MEKKTHYFYALKLPSEIKQHLNEICDGLKGEFPFKTWVHMEDYHITLAFLGHADKGQLQSSINFTKEGLANKDSFPLTINQLGIFGKSDSPRIFWAGTEKEPQLNDCRDFVYQACKQAGFQLETRAFHPHITLARKWISSSPFLLDKLHTSDPIIAEPLTFKAKEVVLYETHLDKTPKYEVKEVFLLK